MILGVDVSTSITGFAIVADEQLVYYGSIDLRKYKNVFDKTIAIKEKILDLYEMYQCAWAIQIIPSNTSMLNSHLHFLIQVAPQQKQWLLYKNLMA